MEGYKKCSIEALQEIWEGYGWLIFDKFEDYVIEVRKVEADIQTGKITLEMLKEEDDEKLNFIQLRFKLEEEAVLN